MQPTSKKKTTSSNDEKHPYLRGPKFWENNKFWLNGMYSPESVEYFETWVADMRGRERSLTRL